ncbi:MAG: AMP-binding protein [Neisseria sp.]|nr:AMP-binding protein [Neisseria sp.]
MLLTQVLSPALNPADVVAVCPAWTRADFNRAVFCLSDGLRKAGARSAALWFEDAALFACAVLAVWHAGGKVLLLPNLARDNLDWGRTADVFLTDFEGLRGKLAGSAPLWYLPDWLARAECGHPSRENYLIPRDAQAWLKTSGSSGEAQVVVKTAAQMEAEALVLADALPLGCGGEAVVGSVVPQHLYGFSFRFALALTTGRPMVRRQAVYPENLLAATAAHEKAVWIASPAVLNRLGANRDWEKIGHKIAFIVSAGGALPEATADLLQEVAVRPFEVYGSTETGVIAWRQDGREWRPFDGVEVGQDGDGALWAVSPWSPQRRQTADLVEPLNGGFLLLGRQDRIIKFEDKRVSLTQIEHELLRHPWIADAHGGRHPQYGRIAVWAALNAAGIGALRDRGRAAVADALKRHLAATQDVVALPRYWRFTDCLPRNAQAKIAAADFQTAFAVAQTSPAWSETWSENETAATFTGRVPLDLAYFGGHFATFPLVPGVVELQWVRDLAERYSWGGRRVVRVENLKYQQFVRPHDEVAVELKYDGDKNKLNFKISKDGNPCASGRIVFEAA